MGSCKFGVVYLWFLCKYGLSKFGSRVMCENVNLGWRPSLWGTSFSISSAISSSSSKSPILTLLHKPSTSGLGLFLHFLSRCSKLFLFLSFPSFQTLSASLVRMVLKVVKCGLLISPFRIHLGQLPPDALPAPPVHQDGVLQLPLHHQLDSPSPPLLLPRLHPRTLLC